MLESIEAAQVVIQALQALEKEIPAEYEVGSAWVEDTLRGATYVVDSSKHSKRFSSYTVRIIPKNVKAVMATTLETIEKVSAKSLVQAGIVKRCKIIGIVAMAQAQTNGDLHILVM